MKWGLTFKRISDRFGALLPSPYPRAAALTVAARVVFAAIVLLSQATGALAQNPTGTLSASVATQGSGILLEGSTVSAHRLQWTVSGTITTCTVSLDTSTDNTTWTVGGMIPGQTCTSAGVSPMTLGASRFVRINLSTLTGGGTVNVVYAAESSTRVNVPANACVNPTSTLTSSVLSLSGTAATQIVALSAGQKIYICPFTVGNGGGTSPTFSLQYGTGTNCATGTTTILPAVAIPAGTAAPLNFPQQSFFVVPAGNALCYILTGTAPTGTLTLNYVQSP